MTSVSHPRRITIHEGLNITISSFLSQRIAWLQSSRSQTVELRRVVSECGRQDQQLIRPFSIFVWLSHKVDVERFACSETWRLYVN